MGTRSLTYFYTEDKKPILCMYRQFDGYMEGHGKELAEFLDSKKIVNGFSGDDDKGKTANGMGDLAAQFVCVMKNEYPLGNVYLYPTDQGQDCWQEYEYHVFPDYVMVSEHHSGKKIKFKGTWERFLKATNAEENEQNPPATKTLQVSESALRLILSKQELTVTFRKRDDTTRVMRCTTNPDLMPANAESYSKVRDNMPSPGNVRVFDLDINEWRSFRFDKVISIESAIV